MLNKVLAPSTELRCQNFGPVWGLMHLPVSHHGSLVTLVVSCQFAVFAVWLSLIDGFRRVFS